MWRTIHHVLSLILKILIPFVADAEEPFGDLLSLFFILPLLLLPKETLKLRELNIRKQALRENQYGSQTNHQHTELSKETTTYVSLTKKTQHKHTYSLSLSLSLSLEILSQKHLLHSTNTTVFLPWLIINNPLVFFGAKFHQIST
jgi:hypothetical protein